ncbi:MAG: alanine--tRNA ligase [Gammaproteobacteria bacterium]|nr:alanine--tRNA ligase [Gammaproteobacteria bacterium]
MGAAEVRRAFLEFFRERGHRVVPSSSLVPGHDPTLLFTNAGMVQFKDLFLGREQRDYSRAVTSQRCVRAGGKHNDLENVGYTARHHTFFEMLGNFSFGDYFKRDAIVFAWEFITQRLGLDPARLHITVFRDDDEAAKLWVSEAGVRPERVTRMGEQSNFWAMGDTGPCGPCTEIFYDHGPGIPGGPPGSPDEDGDRYVEIWNLVFMQYERSADGKLTPLPKPSVDTGSGLERLAAVMQGVHSNYDIDLFRDLLLAAAEAASGAAGSVDLASPSLRVIADHIRACSFLVSDGVVPSNEGRGYVLRRIIRRAVRHGYRLGQSEPFFYKLVPVLARVMGEAYPELPERTGQIARVLRAEEERFAETLAAGMAQFETRMQEAGGSTVPGPLLFLLHDTYGFPPDLTADIARERGLQVDMPGYEREMELQRERARAASRFSVDLTAGEAIDARSEFAGYETLECDSRVVALRRAGTLVQSLQPGEQGEVVLGRTPFYGESGGQVGDTGEITGTGGAHFAVADTQKLGKAIVHIGALTGAALNLGDAVKARVDAARRAAIRLNHSATHLLHAALREVLGRHVTQKGSLVAPDRLRFDFSHFQAVSPHELARIERLVNAEIRANDAARVRLMDYDQAVAAGAMALFGEKYDREVRVLNFGDFSTELCGGTHVARTGDIGLFRILAESGVAAGVRRIEAVTGEGALDAVARSEAVLRDVAGLVRGTRDELADKVREALERIRTQEREIRTLKDKLASGQGTDLAAGAVDVAGTKVIAARVEGADGGSLRNAVDQLKSRLGSAIIVLAAVESPTKVTLVAGVTADRTAKIKAGELVGAVAAQVGGKGGGRPDFAQAGGSNPAALEAALASVLPQVRARLGG